jgi:Fe-S-cluster-containing hydrogenase component 2
LEVCPGGAILSLRVEKKKLTQFGGAKFIKENCVVCTDITDRDPCFEHCPRKAVTLAKKPVVKKTEEKVHYNEGFPF